MEVAYTFHAYTFHRSSIKVPGKFMSYFKDCKKKKKHSRLCKVAFSDAMKLSEFVFATFRYVLKVFCLCL